MKHASTLRSLVFPLIAGFIGGAAGWLFLDATVSAQTDVIEASKVIVGGNIVIGDGRIVLRSQNRNDSYAVMDIQGLDVRDGRGANAQTATVRAGEFSVISRYTEPNEVWKRVELKGGALQYYPEWRDLQTGQDVEVLDMDALFSRHWAELDSIRKTGRRF
jgi:hypothetical protein